MSCQDVIDAAQKCLDAGDIQGLSFVMIPAAFIYELRDALEVYKKEKHFGTPDQVLEEYIPDYEKPCKSVGGLKS